MKRYRKFSRTLVCLLAAAGMFFGTSVMATETGSKAADTKGSAKVEKQVQDSTRVEAGKKREAIVKEAVAALEQTKKAIDALKKKNKQEALDALAMVTGKLEIVLARDPDLANAPIDVRVEQFDLYATVETVQDAVKQAADLLDDGEVQQARMILSGLASEIDIVITALPLKGYTDGIKAVAKLVDDEKYEEATASIYDLLSTLVMTRDVIPLPILRAEELLKKADELARKEGRSADENKELTVLLDNARDQIKMAEALGYGDHKEYKAFYTQIKEIRKKTEDGKFGMGFVDELKNSLKSFKEKILHSTTKASNK